MGRNWIDNDYVFEVNISVFFNENIIYINGTCSNDSIKVSSGGGFPSSFLYGDFKRIPFDIYMGFDEFIEILNTIVINWIEDFEIVANREGEIEEAKFRCQNCGHEDNFCYCEEEDDEEEEEEDES